MTKQEMLPALRQSSDGRVLLTLHVQPGAKRDAVCGMYGEQALKVAISAPPVDGKANSALKKIFSKWLGVPQAQIELKSGETGRDKVFALSGLAVEDIINKLLHNVK